MIGVICISLSFNFVSFFFFGGGSHDTKKILVHADMQLKIVKVYPGSLKITLLD